jgi:hypothetical protein
MEATLATRSRTEGLEVWKWSSELVSVGSGRGAVEAVLAAGGREELEAGEWSSKEVHVGGGGGGSEGDALATGARRKVLATGEWSSESVLIGNGDSVNHQSQLGGERVVGSFFWQKLI